MEQFGTDFNATGSVMNKQELEELRRKRGECVTCGRKCFRKKLFKMIPIDDHGRVLNGRCLNCHPLDANDSSTIDGGIPAVSRPATREDLARFSRSQLNLGPGSLRRNHSNSSATPSSSGAPPRSLGARTQSMLPPRRDNSGSSNTSSRPPNPRATSVLASASSGGSADAARKATAESLGASTPPSRGFGRSVSSAAGLSSSSNHRTPDSERETPVSVSLPVDRSLSRYAMGSSRRSVTSSRSAASMRSTDSNASPPPKPGYASAQDNTPPAGGIPTEVVSQERKPTQEELERAAATIMAAKKYGLNDDLSTHAYQEMQAYPDRLDRYPSDQYDDKYNDNMGRAPSSRSLRSASSIGDASDEDDDFGLMVKHGVLNRGGEFAFHVPSHPNGSQRQVSNIVTGSSRTLSSMSSIEEDHHMMNGHLGRAASVKRITGAPLSTVDALYEGDETNASDPSVTHSQNSSVRQSGRTVDISEEEQHVIQQIRASGHNYGEVLDIMKEYMSSREVVKEALEELACVQMTSEEQNSLSDMGAPNLIADAIQAHETDLEVQMWGCGAIWNLSATLRNQISFVDVGALDLIIAAMDNFVDSIDVQEKALAALAHLGAAEDNLSILVDRGAVGRIVQAMNKHSDDASVQAKGCTAVTNLASHESPLKEQIMDLAGGAVVICMVMHPEDFFLQEKALRALRNLCANNEENKVKLAHIGGIDTVISAMQVHRDEAGVQEEGAWTLSNLAGNDENKATIGDCGGIDVIIRAMWVHSDNANVQEWCCRALFTLTLDVHNGNVVLNLGGISAVINSMQAHVDSPAVQEMGCAVLSNLADDDAIKMRIVDEEALDAIVLAMVLHCDDPQVQERACVVLLRIAIPENFKSMLAANVNELVKTAAEKFPDRCDEPSRRLQHVLEAY